MTTKHEPLSEEELRFALLNNDEQDIRTHKSIFNTHRLLATIRHLQAKVGEQKKTIEQSCEDWAEDDTALRDLARNVLDPLQIDGDSNAVPHIVEVITMMKARLVKLWEENHIYQSTVLIPERDSLKQRAESAERELKETKTFLGYKNDTANTFMNQVKKLQAENHQLREALEKKDEMLKDILVFFKVSVYAIGQASLNGLAQTIRHYIGDTIKKDMKVGSINSVLSTPRHQTENATSM